MRHYVLIKDFNTLTFDNTLHRVKKHFCCYCLQAFSTEEMLRCHIKGCFKSNGKQKKLTCLKKVKYVKFENYKKSHCS